MNTAVVLYGVLLFFLCLAVHIMIWRIKTPWVSSLVLLVIFIAVPTAAVLAAVTFLEIGVFTCHLGSIGLLQLLLLHLSLSAAYIASYPAARAVSPTLDILLMISSAEGRKMTEAAMKDCFTHKRLISARIDDLKAYHFVQESGGRFELRGAAAVIVKIFVLYRRMLGLPMGGG